MSSTDLHNIARCALARCHANFFSMGRRADDEARTYHAITELADTLRYRELTAAI
jgi:hypothetical protein